MEPECRLTPGRQASLDQRCHGGSPDDGSGYTGITSAFIDGKRYLYVANFLKGRIDVYDNAFTAIKLKGDRSWPRRS